MHFRGSGRSAEIGATVSLWPDSAAILPFILLPILLYKDDVAPFLLFLLLYEADSAAILPFILLYKADCAAILPFTLPF